MSIHLREYAADHRRLLELAARHANLQDAVAVHLGEFTEPLIKASRKGPVVPVRGVMVRDWDPDNRRVLPGVLLGARLYEIAGIRFARIHFSFDDRLHHWGLDFVAVSRRDYTRLYRLALRCRRDSEPPSSRPVLPQEQVEVLWQNTIGYLQRDNLRRVRAFGGRARRGVLLTGAPGNGKTMACRWIWEECRRRRWEWRLVTPDTYRQARASCDPVEAVKALFTVERRGVVFFDDMDLALRDREKVRETEDQAIFLSALDGIEVREGVVFVFTTNCSLELIDRAFKRPGRIDVVLQFEAPTSDLRLALVERWHAEIVEHLDVNRVVAATEGCSFAEMEELKNLLVMHFAENGVWDWEWATRQFDINRAELAAKRERHVGFMPRNGINGE